MHARDYELQANVIDEIHREPGIDTSRIGVTVIDGVATLYGALASLTMIDAAIDAVLRVPGIRGVANCVAFRCSGSLRRTDADIAADVADALRRSGSDPAIKALVRDGEVRLLGLIDRDSDRAKALRAVANASPHIRGVTRILDQLVASRPTAVPQAMTSDALSAGAEQLTAR